MTDSSAITSQSSSIPSSRIYSVDMLRGVVMIIMALDHVREYWSQTPFRPEDLTQTDVPLFFTRWITYFCAPIFVFLSGIGVYLYGRKVNSLRAVSKYLLTRGLWLVVLEVVVVSFLLQFGYNFIIIQVIWVIGWGMILLAGLIWLPRWALIAFVALLICGHNLFLDVPAADNFFLAMLHNSPFVFFTSSLPPLLFSYVLIPWVAVLALGYLIGAWYDKSVEQQRTLFRISGISLLIFFVVLRALNVYGDPVPWSVQPRGLAYTFLSFVSVLKYPPSLLFLSLTLGSGMLMLSFFYKNPGRIGKFVLTFGKVPMFYYLLHIPLIVGSAVIWAWIAFDKFTIVAFSSSMKEFPSDYAPSLLRAYVVWVVVMLILYFPCRWYARYKSSHRYWWLTYL